MVRIVKDDCLYSEIITSLKRFAKKRGLNWVDSIDLPILGGNGNKNTYAIYENPPVWI
jgi:predicted rRNA methylase YqxC with S4 and FtsJ domains